MIKTFVAIALLVATTSVANAADVGLVGLFPGKAVLVVDGAPPKTYAVGSTLALGVRLVAANSENATIEVDGKRQVLRLDQYVHRSAPSDGSSVLLKADVSGHFIAKAQINGHGIDMLVDTGASFIALPASEATRLGIKYKNGTMGSASTANGVVPMYLVKIDTIRIGDVELHQIEAMVQESGLPFALLGMSFLNRMEMRREGDEMRLTKRY